MQSNFSSFTLRLLALLLIFTSYSAAQNSGITNFEVLDNPPKLDMNSTEAEKIKDLVFGSHPIVFIEEKESFSYGDGDPVTAEVAYNNLELLSQENELFNAVELLVVKINGPEEFRGNGKLQGLANFPSLKYIVIQCGFDCNISQLDRTFAEVHDLKVFYQIAKPQ